MKRQHAHPARRDHLAAVAGAVAILAVIGALCLYGAPIR